ncbi:hypothetical protein [Hymenobacter jeollabukensis]|uniref:Uncharacterized protein n=1 Tax=Hymenobacter jeollabukensis TaxID=2025313 RepID=A0A5R8WN07_9BACT|nr:hypothetical protein [Hymenobacter jeollabukensis]TLM91095.1 hypothetical protein FDY95_15990 [Hymenobacter jeollabukensis]
MSQLRDWQRVMQQLRRDIPVGELQALWYSAGFEFSAEALAACRAAAASANYQPLTRLPYGSGLTDNLILLFVQISGGSPLAVLVLDPFELWDNETILDVVPAASIPAKAELLI